MSQYNTSSNYPKDISSAMFADCLANSKKIFELIDTVFPVDSCRHYEVLPLDLVGKDLALGMLDPSNEESLKFVNSIAKVFKYNLTLKIIDSQTLQIILASHPQNLAQLNKQNKQQDLNKTVIDEASEFDRFANGSGGSGNRRISDSAPTVISQPDEQSSLNPSEKSFSKNFTDLPADLDFLRDLNLSPENNAESSRREADRTGTLYEIPPEFLNQPQSSSQDDKKTVISVDSDDSPELNIPDESELALAQAKISELIAEVSEQIEKVETKEKSASIDFLAQLDSQLSWQKLLEQAFKYKSEEIHLTRYEDSGDVIAHKDDAAQSCLERVPLPIYCSLIDEIKRMAKIPLNMTNHPKKVVLERFYQQERILLRLEFATGNNCDSVKIQIFRGENLAVYEQKQMDKTSEQALHLARQLERTLRKIQACFDSAEFTCLRELQTIQSRINHQLRLLDK